MIIDIMYREEEAVIVLAVLLLDSTARFSTVDASLPPLTWVVL